MSRDPFLAQGGLTHETLVGAPSTTLKNRGLNSTQFLLNTNQQTQQNPLQHQFGSQKTSSQFQKTVLNGVLSKQLSLKRNLRCRSGQATSKHDSAKKRQAYQMTDEIMGGKLVRNNRGDSFLDSGKNTFFSQSLTRNDTSSLVKPWLATLPPQNQRTAQQTADCTTKVYDLNQGLQSKKQFSSNDPNLKISSQNHQPGFWTKKHLETSNQTLKVNSLIGIPPQQRPLTQQQKVHSAKISTSSFQKQQMVQAAGRLQTTQAGTNSNLGTEELDNSS